MILRFIFLVNDNDKIMNSLCKLKQVYVFGIQKWIIYNYFLCIMKFILVKIDLKFYCEMLGYINLDFGIYNGIQVSKLKLYC